MSINIINKKILFLGYGAVAKCVWNYFDQYFIFNRKRVVLVDKSKEAFYGPNLSSVKKIVMNVDATNFDDLIVSIGIKKGDIIIDLTTSSSTYYFIKQCLEHGFNYINTSIEDQNDKMLGTSIDCQQHTVAELSKKFKAQSNVLTECGQNPGLIQHYILYALHKMDKIKNNKSNFKKQTMRKVIDEYKVGTILMSEVDCMKRVSDTKLDDTKIYNTWSVTGFVAEASDKTELVCGKNNSFIQPIISTNNLSKITMEVYPSLDDYKVLFLNEIGLYTSLNSICPLLNNDKIEFTNYRGRLIHHGEIFEMARYFGKNAPFMSYVYQNSQYIDESIKKFSDNIDDLWLYVNQENTTTVFDNIKDKLVGSDSVGCTIFCGDKKVERIFWCGSILSHTDKCVKPEFTPTIVQVCAGVLAGLSYILEDKNKNMGWVESTDLDTMYMLEKSIPLLGKFMFLEIPIDKFSGPISLKKY